MKGIPARFIPTGEQQRYNTTQGTPEDLDLAGLSIKPAAALFTCYGGNAKAGIGLSGDVNGYSIIIPVNESVLIENFESLVDMKLTCIGSVGQTADVTVVYLSSVV